MNTKFCAQNSSTQGKIETFPETFMNMGTGVKGYPSGGDRNIGVTNSLLGPLQINLTTVDGSHHTLPLSSMKFVGWSSCAVLHFQLKPCTHRVYP